MQRNHQSTRKKTKENTGSAPNLSLQLNKQLPTLDFHWFTDRWLVQTAFYLNSHPIEQVQELIFMSLHTGDDG